MTRNFLVVTADAETIASMKKFASDMDIFHQASLVESSHKRLRFLKWEWQDVTVTVDDILPFSAEFPTARLNFGVQSMDDGHPRVAFIAAGEIVGTDCSEKDSACFRSTAEIML